MTNSKSSIFNILYEIFNKHNVQVVLIGGYALIASKIHRMTFDVDFMITKEDSIKIKSDIINLGYSVINDESAFLQLKSKKMGLRDLDFILVDDYTIKAIIDDGKEVIIAGENFIIPCPIHIISMKLHAISQNKKRMNKDFLDIVELITLNNINPQEDSLKKLFEKFNVLNLYKRLLETIG